MVMWCCRCALMQVTVSIIILGMFVLLELGPDSPQFMPLLHALLPWALHHRHAVRVPVQVSKGAPVIWNHAAKYASSLLQLAF